MKKYLMITGSYPPEICGVGDYTACLMETASEEWELYKPSSWRLRDIFNIIRAISSKEIVNLFMQYPTQGYGWSLVPQLICLYFSLFTKKKFVVVLHEFSQRTIKAKLASIPLLLANRLIFTSDYERLIANRYLLGFANHKASVIGIRSNIQACEAIKKYADRSFDLVYFGHLRPMKGLEDFIEVANQLLIYFPNLSVHIIGQKLTEYEKYIGGIIEKSNPKIEFHFNESSSKVSELLNNSKVVYLPFVDGLSERRGSFLAAISNGTLVASYQGKFTTNELLNIFNIINRKNKVGDLMKVLTNLTPAIYELFQDKCKEYLNSSLPKSWDEVVKQYEQVVL